MFVIFLYLKNISILGNSEDIDKILHSLVFLIYTVSKTGSETIFRLYFSFIEIFFNFLLTSHDFSFLLSHLLNVHR